jgi:uncharacterized protein YceH (UPF0502 family)
VTRSCFVAPRPSIGSYEPCVDHAETQAAEEGRRRQEAEARAAELERELAALRARLAAREE